MTALFSKTSLTARGAGDGKVNMLNPGMRQEDGIFWFHGGCSYG